jgi:hypothetical protein
VNLWIGSLEGDWVDCFAGVTLGAGTLCSIGRWADGFSAPAWLFFNILGIVLLGVSSRSLFIWWSLNALSTLGKFTDDIIVTTNAHQCVSYQNSPISPFGARI